MSSQNNPLVSVFMPVYNQERYVAAALDSVLGQTYENFEIVISDDCSRDSTPQIVQDFSEKYPNKIRFYKLSNENLGGKHFQLLLEQCKGEYVCMFSGDDIMYPEKLANQMNDVLRFGLQFHGHSVNCIDEFGSVFSSVFINENRFYKSNGELILKGIPAAGCSWLVKRSHAKFDHSLSFLHDFDMVVRVLSCGGLGYICAKKLGAYRVTKSSWSRNLSFWNYVEAYSNLAMSWIKNKMYKECGWLVLRVLIRLPSMILRVFNSKY